MWRATFLAFGTYTALLGAECLVLDKAVLAEKGNETAGMLGQPRSRELVPPEWAPWTLLSAGAVTMLYTWTLPKKVAS